MITFTAYSSSKSVKQPDGLCPKKDFLKHKKICENKAVIRYEIKASTSEEAMVIFYWRNGWGEYVCSQDLCPKGHYYALYGSGKCFCGYDNDNKKRRRSSNSRK